MIVQRRAKRMRVLPASISAYRSAHERATDVILRTEQVLISVDTARPGSGVAPPLVNTCAQEQEHVLPKPMMGGAGTRCAASIGHDELGSPASTSGRLG